MSEKAETPSESNPYRPPEAPLTIAEPPTTGLSMIVLLQIFFGMFIFSAISTCTIILLLQADLSWLSVVWLVLPMCFLLGIGLGWHKSIVPSSLGLLGLVLGMAVASVWTLGLEATGRHGASYLFVSISYCSGREAAWLIRKSRQPQTAVKYEYKQHLR